MFQRKRQFKKEKAKKRFKLTLMILFFLLIILILTEFFYLNFYSPRSNFISPIAKNSKSSLGSLESKFEEKKISYTKMSASSDGSFIVKLSGGGEVILSSKKDIGSQLSSLQLILSRLTIEGKRLKSLDFRFDNPVVSF